MHSAMALPECDSWGGNPSRRFWSCRSYGYWGGLKARSVGGISMSISGV
jgi:hypothetical protein